MLAPSRTARIRIATLLLFFPSLIGTGPPTDATVRDEPVGDVRPPSADLVLSSVPLVRQLSADEARSGYAVRLQGVVTYVDTEWHWLFVQDEHAGIFVTPETAPENLRIGDRVEIVGRTGPGEFAPIILDARVQFLGREGVPVAQRVTVDDLTTGAEDSQWVEVAGVVRTVELIDDRATLTIASGNARLMAVLDGPWDRDLPTELIDAAVRVQGVCGTLFNQDRQLIGVQLFVQDLSFVLIDEAGPDDAFALPERSLRSLLQFAPRGRRGHRVKVKGVVTVQHPGRSLFIQDGMSGLYIETRDKQRVRPGDIVEVVGFPAVGSYTPVLQDAIFRKVGTGAEPQPAAVTANQALNGSPAGDLYDAELVRIVGRLVEQTDTAGETILTLQAGSHLFTARLARDGAPPPSLTAGSILQLTGVNSVHVDESRRPRIFRIYPRTAADIVVLRSAPWWSARHILGVVGLLTAGVLLALGWVRVLRMRVREQTEVIRGQLEIEASLKKKAETANRAKDAYLAVMSHEIRTPLCGVIGVTDLLAETRLGEDQREYVKLLSGSARTLLAIVNDILDLSKIEAGRLDLEHVPFDLAQVLDQTIEPQAIQAQRKHLELQVAIQQGVPKRLLGDPTRLGQVLTNLVGNALKFTESGGVYVTIAAGERRDGHQLLHFMVRDTGIGIPGDRQAAIFEEFSQADSATSRHYGGTGLGLVIASRLVEKMGGRIEVDSEVGAGSTFRFIADFQLLPEEHQPAACSEAIERIPQLSRSLRILVAEDNTVNQRLFRLLLERRGHDVTMVADGREAVEMFERRPFDLILMDVQMPGMNGLEATAEIRTIERARGSHIPIAALTARVLKEDNKVCRDAGMDAHLTKPLDPELLFETIGRLTGRIDPPAGTTGGGDGSITARELRVRLPDLSPPSRNESEGIHGEREREDSNDD